MNLNIYNVYATALVWFASETSHFLFLRIIASMFEQMHVL